MCVCIYIEYIYIHRIYIYELVLSTNNLNVLKINSKKPTKKLLAYKKIWNRPMY